MRAIAPRRSFTAALVALCLLLAPVTALAKKGEKNYNRGLQHERSQQWEKAAQEFALAVAASPSDTEYQLHYRRAIFNASQSYMQKGRALAEQGDYAGAYNAFRQAYGLDPVNELAASEMGRVLRLQREKEGLSGPANGAGPQGGDARSQVSPTSYSPDGARGAQSVGSGGAGPQEGLAPTRSEQLRTIDYTGDLEPFIRKLAEELELNVVFDQNFSQQPRKINLHLRNVSAAQALDYIFKSYGLFFQKLSRRTILVADQSKRPQYQELVLRTFYLFNIEPEEARTLIQTALPANAGRQPQVVINKATNSITVRDTPENIRIIGDLLKSTDKDRAEVVMEVNIYEVSRTDLLQIGNQLGTADTLANLGGSQAGAFGGGGITLGSGTTAVAVPSFLSAAVLVPASAISLLQGKNNSRLVFSTQVHAFDAEKSETRVGAKVPVQTASVTPFGFNGNQPAGGTGGTTSGIFGNGFPVIQYEDTGLSLDFTPKVFPNHDVQVKMVIDTKDTSISGSGNALTPTFTQRRITGTARVPNGRTMMIASIAQDRQSQGRQGLPLLGLIPVLGRLVTTPRRDNSANDVVITLTPRVLRAPNITPRDEDPRPSGTMQTPSAETLEAMVRDADREDQLAGVRRPAPPAAVVNSAPPQPSPEEVSFVPAPKNLGDALGTGGATAAAANGDGTASGDGAPPAAMTTAAAVTTTVAHVADSGGGTSARPAVAVPALATGDAMKLMPAPASVSPAPLTGGGETAAVPAVLLSEKNPAAAVTDAARTAATTPAPVTDKPAASAVTAAAPAESAAELTLVPERQELKVGERRRVMLMLKTDAPLGLLSATLRFDPRVVAVRAVTPAMLSADKALAPVVTQSVDPSGVLLVSVTPGAGAPPLTGEGLLLFIEVEGVTAGECALTLDADKAHLAATDGRGVRARVTPTLVKVTP